MGIFNNIFPRKEIRLVLNVMDEFEFMIKNNDDDSDVDVENPASDLTRTYKMVKEHAKQTVLKDSSNIIKILEEGRSPRGLAYTLIAKWAERLVASGEFHIYRGRLSPLGPGKDLLRIFDLALRELESVGEISTTDAKEYKSIVLEEIAEVG